MCQIGLQGVLSGLRWLLLAKAAFVHIEEYTEEWEQDERYDVPWVSKIYFHGLLFLWYMDCWISSKRFNASVSRMLSVASRLSFPIVAAMVFCRAATSCKVP